MYKNNLQSINDRLSAALHNEQVAENKEKNALRVVEVPIDKISYSPYQTREIDSEESLEELSKSIESKGVIQPIIVREKDAAYELIAGERRLRAAEIAGLNSIPVIIREFDEQGVVEVSIIENAQRENLNPIEEALSYKILVEQFKLTQKSVAELIGKSRVAISNALRLLQLNDKVIEFIKEGELSAGHGKALLALDDPKLQLRVAKRTIKNSLSVRALEKLVSRIVNAEEIEEFTEEEEKEFAKLERQMRRVEEYLGLEDQVSLSRDAQGFRRLNLVFETEASWKRFISKIKN